MKPSDRVELLDGLLVGKMSQNPAHAVAAELVVNALREMLPAGGCVRSEKPIALPHSAPEPDAAAAAGSARDYLRRHPGPADLLLVVEISDTTIDSDRRARLSTYAEGGIVCCWIVNLTSRSVEVYTQPSGPSGAPRYGNRQDFAAGQAVSIIVAGKVAGTVAVDDLLP